MAFTEYQSRWTRVKLVYSSVQFDSGRGDKGPRTNPFSYVTGREQPQPKSFLLCEYGLAWNLIYGVEEIALYCGREKTWNEISNDKKKILWGAQLQSYRHLCRVHEAQPKVIFLYDVQMVHDLVKQLLSFGFFLRREAHHIRKGKKREELDRWHPHPQVWFGIETLFWDPAN